MAKRSNVIEINGRKYDASTGELIKEKTAASPRRVDGFAKPSSQTSSSATKILSPKEVQREVKKRSIHANEVHSRTSKSKTLVRSATQKPKRSSFRSRILTSATAFAKGSPTAKNELAHSVSDDKLKTAQSSKQSGAISKFYSGDERPKVSDKQVSPTSPSHQPVSKKEQLIAESMARVDASKDTGTKSKSGYNPFSKAAQAVKKSPKITTIVATSLAAILLFGYITYLNIPNVALRVAAVKAGFSASMPGYSPNGFRFTGPVAYSPGQITIKFDSNTDDREYTITQRETSWDSKSLLDNFVKEEVACVSCYSTVYDRGLTVYIYDGSNASWVNGGIWYTVSGDSLLSSEQLLRIAASL